MANVLLIKSQKPEDPFIQALEHHHFKATCIPALSFQYKNISELADKLKNVEHYSGLLLTSQNSVEACKKAQDCTDEDILSRRHSKSNYVVGESTKAAAKKLLNLDCRGAESGNAATLANFVQTDMKSEDTLRFLYPKTSLKTVELSVHFSEYGFKVEELEVYNTLPDPDFVTHIQEYRKVLGSSPDVVVFFSPSGVDYCLEAVTSVFEMGVKFVAIGPSTSQRLLSRGVPDHLVLEKPNGESLISCLQERLVI